MALTSLASGKGVEGCEIASAAVQRIARQQPKAMRSASLSYIKQAIKEKWKPQPTDTKNIWIARKSVAGQCLQLKSDAQSQVSTF